MAYKDECYSDADLGNFSTVEEVQLDLKEVISYNFSDMTCVTWDHKKCTLESYLSSNMYDNFIFMQGDLFFIFIGLDLQQDHNDALVSRVLVENGTYVYETDGTCVIGTPFHVIQLILRESQECNVTSTPSTVTSTWNTPVKPSTSTSPRTVASSEAIISVLLPITIILGIDLLL